MVSDRILMIDPYEIATYLALGTDVSKFNMVNRDGKVYEWLEDEFNAVTGDFPPTAGRIHFFGEDITELAPHLRHALNSPLRRIIAQLDSHPGLDIASLSPRIAREPAALSTQIGSFIGDTPELLAQIEEAIDLQDLALAQGLNNALYNNASRLGLSNLSHALAQLATCLQPQRAHSAHPQLAEAEREYMAAFPVILKLRTALQELF
jgi:hypothetical protein